MTYNPRREVSGPSLPRAASKGLRVVVSHPARQANIYYRPRAAEQMGAEVMFLTGLYYRPDRFPYSIVRYLPTARRERVEIELEKRRLEGLSPENVISLLGPALEATLRPMGKLREWFAIHDWLASRWVSREKNIPKSSPSGRCIVIPFEALGKQVRGRNKLLQTTNDPERAETSSEEICPSFG